MEICSQNISIDMPNYVLCDIDVMKMLPVLGRKVLKQSFFLAEEGEVISPLQVMFGEDTEEIASRPALPDQNVSSKQASNILLFSGQDNRLWF